MNNKILHRTLLSAALTGCVLLSYSAKIGSDKEAQGKRELKYYEEAEVLNGYLYEEDVKTDIKTIKETLESIDKLLPHYFPNGPFTRNDFVSIAMLESNFDKYCVGTHGEKGIFQIMPDEFKESRVYKNKSKYEVFTNTDICMRVLSYKYGQFPDYKLAVIAYNGVVKTKSGKWSEKYWNAFSKRKFIVDHLFNS